jgi:hypothetical protein
MASKYTITYRCGYQRQDFIYVAEEYIPQKLAKFARTLCTPCQKAQEQRQFEAIQQANQVQNVTERSTFLMRLRCSSWNPEMQE